MTLETGSFLAAFEARFNKEFAALKIEGLVYDEKTLVAVENLAFRLLQQLADEKAEIISNKEAIIFVATVMAQIDFKDTKENSLPSEA